MSAGAAGGPGGVGAQPAPVGTAALLVVFAKRPEPGAVKTRLCPPFTEAQAAELYACMLDDVLESSHRAARELDLALGLAVYPPEATAEVGHRAPPGTRLFPQQGGDLGERMEHVLATAGAQGFRPVLLRGSDSPTLPRRTLAAAAAALRTAGGPEGVIGPDPDGGYHLVGLREPMSGLFSHAMSTSSVLGETRARAEARGLRIQLLEPGFDVDTAADLQLLAAARRRGEAEVCPRTLAWLDARAAWPDETLGSARPGDLSREP